MSLKVHFVLSAVNVEFPVRWLLEIGQYAAFLRQSGIAPQLTLLLKAEEAEAVEAMKSGHPELVVLFALPGQMKPLSAFAEKARGKLRSSLFVAAGLLPTLDPEGVIANRAIDGLLLGEGEIALVELASALERRQDYRTLRNFWIRDRAGNVQKNPLRPLVENLDVFPYADRTIFDHERWLRISGGNVGVIASRGCVHNCLFCHLPRLREIYKGKGPAYRVRTPLHIMGEIAEVARDHDIRRVTFLDEMFPLDLEWVTDFVKRYGSHFKVPFTITGEAERLNARMLELLKAAGCDTVQLGIETGNQAFRKKLADRNAGNDNLLKTASLIQSHGMKVVTTNIIGWPVEKPEMVQETLNLNRELRPDEVRVSVFDPIPSTRLYEFCVEKKYFRDVSRADIQPWESTLNLPMLPADEIRSYYEKFHILHSLLSIARLGEKKGYFDFLAELAKAKIVSRNRFDAQVSEISLYGQTRTAIAQVVNSSLNYEVQLEESAAISFGLAVKHGMIPVSAKVLFSVEITQGDYTQTLFQKTLNVEEPRDMRWFDYDLPVMDIVPGMARVSFKVEMAEAAGDGEMWALWSRPFLSNRLMRVAGKLKVVEGTGYESADATRRELEEKEKLCASLQSRVEEYEKRVKELEAEIKQKTQRTAEAMLKMHELESDLEHYRNHVAELEEIRAEYERSLGKKIKGIFRKK